MTEVANKLHEIIEYKQEHSMSIAAILLDFIKVNDTLQIMIRYTLNKVVRL